MKTNDRKIYTLSDIKVTFRPKSITFNRAKQGIYRLYLEKNVQVISQINQTIKIHPKNPTYIFSSSLEVKPFRIVNDKQCSYQISLYQLQQNGEEILKDSTEFSLSKFIRNYFVQFQKLDEQVKGKEKSTIADHWRALSNNFTKKTYSTTVKFTASDAVMEILCLPETEYDCLVRQDDILRQKKKEFEEKIKKRSQFTKSKTLPTLKLENQISNLAKKYHENDSDAALLDGQAAMDQKAKKELSQSLKRFTIKLPQAHKSQPETQNSSNNNKVISDLSKESKLKNQKSSSFLKEIFIDDPIEEEIEREENQSFKSIEQKVPTLEIKHFRTLQNPQTNSFAARIGNLSLNSMVSSQKYSDRNEQTKGSTKQTLLTIFWIILNLLLIIYLMHPMPKY